MQILASKKVYMFFYGAIGIIKVSAELQIFAKLCGQNSKIQNVVCFRLGGSPSSN